MVDRVDRRSLWSEQPGEDAGGTGGELRSALREAIEMNRADALREAQGSYEEEAGRSRSVIR
jgi:hypothetical protein